jgi:hypothetical protein
VFSISPVYHINVHMYILLCDVSKHWMHIFHKRRRKIPLNIISSCHVFILFKCDNGTYPLTLSWPAKHTRILVCPTYKESFQARWDNSISLFLRAAVYLEVSLFRWTSQNAFSRETSVYKWYCVQCCYADISREMHSDWFYGIEMLQGRWQHGEKVGYCYPRGLEKTLCNWNIYVPLVTKGLCIFYRDWCCS